MDKIVVIVVGMVLYGTAILYLLGQLLKKIDTLIDAQGKEDEE